MEEIILNAAEVTDEMLDEVAGGKTYYEIYTVVKGDNLTKIAKAYSTTWQKIYALNKKTIGPDPNKIYPGQQLKIPN